MAEIPHSPSSDQIEIIEAIARGENICVNANPGSGKTTLCLHIMKHFPNKQILALTFSKLLQVDSDKKHKKYIKNTKSVFKTIDSVKYTLYNDIKKDFDNYKDTMFNDRKILNFDIIILDELQDIGLEKYKFLCLLLKICKNKNPIIITLGDSKQSIFTTMAGLKSDNRFLVYSPEVFPSTNSWTRKILHETFRIPYEIANFLNISLLGSEENDVIISHKESKSRPKIYFENKKINPKDRSNNINLLVVEVENFISMGYNAEDIMIIMPYNLRKDGDFCINEMVNKFVNKGYDFYISEKNMENKSAKMREGKISILTCHGSKGLESKIVIRLNFNQATVEKFNPNHNYNKINNLDFVSLTRSLEHLIIFTDGQKLPNYVNLSTLKDTCDTFGTHNTNISLPRERQSSFGVKEFLEKYEECLLETCIDDSFKETICEDCGYDPIIETTSVTFNGTQGGFITEDISEYYGTGVPLYSELNVDGKASILESLKLETRILSNCDFKDKLYTILNRNNFLSMYEQIREGNISFDDPNILSIIPFACILKKCFSTQTVSFLNQVKNYKWFKVSERMLDQLNELNLNGKFELETNVTIKANNKIMELNGIIDYIDDTRIIEFKVKSELTISDYLQVLIYKYSIFKETGENKEAHLVNLATCEHIKINVDPNKILSFLQYLINYKEEVRNNTDEEFVIDCLNFLDEENLHN